MQLVEDVTMEWKEMTEPVIVKPIFTAEAEVLKELVTSPTITFMAEVGGVLGLFFGFNFLMVWKWIVWCFRRLCTVVCPLTNVFQY